MKTRRLVVGGLLSLIALCGLGLWLFFYGYDSEERSATLYRHASGYEVAEIFHSSGLMEPDADDQVLVRANSHGRWKALWSSFHVNSSPRFFWSKTGSWLFINECIPVVGDESHACGASFFTMAYNFSSGQSARGTLPPNPKNDRIFLSIIGRQSRLIEAKPQGRRALGKWFWQDYQLKLAYGY